jgi:hypothetical protein
MTGIESAGHADATGSRTVVRFATSSTSTRTAVRSCTFRLGGVTMLARVRSRSDASAVPAADESFCCAAE